MKRRSVVGLAILSVATYAALVIGLRFLLAVDKTGNWITAVVLATGVATAVLTGLLVRVTWLYVELTGSYVQLTARMVELEASAPARAAEQQALRDFLNTFATAERFASSMPIDAEYVLSIVTIKGITSTDLAKVEPPEAREEWETIAKVSGAAVTLDALHRARDRAVAALVPPPHQN
jgi:hypothetical protein